MDCPKCGCPASSVLYTRRRTFIRNGEEIGRRIRRRECAHCRHRFTTREESAGGTDAKPAP